MALLPIFCLILLLLNAGSADATVFATNRGIGARALGMGGAFTAVADDPFATYYNPAGLAQLRGHRLQLDYLMVIPQVYLQTGDKKEHFLNHTLKMPLLGFVFDLSRAIKLPRNLVLGVNAYVGDNTKSAWKIRYGSMKYDPYYALYGANMHEEEAFGVWVGIGFEIFSWLMLGGGVNFDLNAVGCGAVLGVNQSLEVVNEESKIFIDITSDIFPVLGVILKPTSRLRLGFTWRRHGIFTLGGGVLESLIKIDLGGEDELQVPLVVGLPLGGAWRPSQYALGGAYQLRDDLLLALDLVYFDYRPYIDNAKRHPEPPMKEILVPRFGIEYTLREDMALRTGYSFRMSPLSQQNPGYHTNLIDNDVHILSLGFGYTFQLFGFPRNPAELSLTYQLYLLGSRTFENVHAGEGDLKSTGMFHLFGLGLQFRM